MSVIFIVMAGMSTLLDTANSRLRTLRTEDRGSVTVEQVILTGVVLLAAIAVGGAITLAVKNRVGAIN